MDGSSPKFKPFIQATIQETARNAKIKSKKKREGIVNYAEIDICYGGLKTQFECRCGDKKWFVISQ